MLRSLNQKCLLVKSQNKWEQSEDPAINITLFDADSVFEELCNIHPAVFLCCMKHCQNSGISKVIILQGWLQEVLKETLGISLHFPCCPPLPQLKGQTLELKVADSSYSFQPYSKRETGTLPWPSNNIPTSLCSITSASLQQDTHISEYASSSYPQGLTSPTQHHHWAPDLLFLHLRWCSSLGKQNYNVWNAKKLFCSPTFFFFWSVAVLSLYPNSSLEILHW